MNDRASEAIEDSVARLIEVLKQRREELGWTRDELAWRMGGRRAAQVASWEALRGVPRLSVLLHWVYALGFALDLRELTEEEAERGYD